MPGCFCKLYRHDVLCVAASQRVAKYHSQNASRGVATLCFNIDCDVEPLWHPRSGLGMGRTNGI